MNIGRKGQNFMVNLFAHGSHVTHCSLCGVSVSQALGQCWVLSPPTDIIIVMHRYLIATNTVGSFSFIQENCEADKVSGMGSPWCWLHGPIHFTNIMWGCSLTILLDYPFCGIDCLAEVRSWLSWHDESDIIILFTVVFSKSLSGAKVFWKMFPWSSAGRSYQGL